MRSLIINSLIVTGLVSLANAHIDGHGIGQVPLTSFEDSTFSYSRPSIDKNLYIPSFAGISTYAHLPYLKCWEENVEEDYDIAVIGVPYDIGVTFRTGARFGPSGIREGSKRIKGYNNQLHINPFRSWAKAVDCGDIPFEPFDAEHAISQIETHVKYVLSRPARPEQPQINKGIPRLITLGGDHTILLPILRSMYQAHGKPITVIHFDSHLDTWAPEIYNVKARGSKYNHGNSLYHASKEGLIAQGNSLHVGIRSTLYDKDDIKRDEALGFHIVKADDIFELGVQGISKAIRDILGSPDDVLVYLSIDIDVIDPSMAPATGTPETGGFLTREMRYILRSLEEYNIIGMDVVEVAPAYDTQAQLTTFLAADLIYDVFSMMVKYGKNHKSQQTN